MAGRDSGRGIILPNHNAADMADSKTQEGVGRIKINVSDNKDDASVNEVYHHGRCEINNIGLQVLLALVCNTCNPCCI